PPWRRPRPGARGWRVDRGSRPAMDVEVKGQAVNQVGWDILIVLAIVLVGGFFAGAEMALVSLREGQVRRLRKRGKRGQRAARLAPKRLALQRPESLALIAAPVLDRISVLARPLVWLLSQSTNLVVRLLGGDPAAGRGVMTEEELRDLVAGNQALSADERHIV